MITLQGGHDFHLYKIRHSASTTITIHLKLLREHHTYLASQGEEITHNT